VGASLLFPPQYQTPGTAQEALLQIVHTGPRTLGFSQTRWTLAAISNACDWLRLTTSGGLSRLLARLKISWKRGREHIYSPDPDYEAKLTYIKNLTKDSQASRGQRPILYLDEVTYYRQPTTCAAYELQGHRQPLAERSYQSNTLTRVIATLDVANGRVVHRWRSHLTVRAIVAFYQQLCDAYPGAERLYVVQDNWPVHTHPDVLVALESQEQPWPWHRPGNWPTSPSVAAQRHWGGLHLPIQIVTLPTYAPWTNPIEKLWRWLRQEVLHMHRLSDQLEELRAEIDRFLDRFASGSPALLRYVGLLPN